MRLNPDYTVSVSGGETLRNVADFLALKNRGLEGIPAYGNITIGGLLGTGAHGSSIRHSSSLSNEVISLLVLDGGGKMREIWKESDLRAFRVHLGLLGIILEVKLRTVPLYKLRAFNRVEDDILLTQNDNLIELVQSADYIAFYWFPSLKKVVVANWTKVSLYSIGSSWTNDHVPSTTYAFNLIVKKAFEIAQNQKNIEVLNLIQRFSFLTLTKKFPTFPPIYTEDGRRVKNPAIGLYYQMFSPICKNVTNSQCPWAHGENGLKFIDNEISIEIGNLKDALKRIKGILEKYPAVFPFQGIVLRFSGASKNSLMSVERDRVSCHLEFFIVKRKEFESEASVGIGAYQAIMQMLIHEFKGRSHWGKSGPVYHSSESLQLKLDPNVRDEFILKMKEFDPNGIFMNSFGRRLLGIEKKMKINDPRVVHCSLLDYCTCTQDSDCGNEHKCSKIKNNENYPICMPKLGNYSSIKLINYAENNARDLLRQYFFRAI